MVIKSDVIIIGAGAAGMMCAAQAAQKGLKVQLIDHAKKLAEKIRISGGGRCNFTNIGTTWENYVSDNPRFSRYALSSYTPQHFLELLERYQIAWHEKHKGQLFCDQSSQQVIDLLVNECKQGGVQWQMPCQVETITYSAEHFELQTSRGLFKAPQLVIATGGLAMPQLGATDFALKIAKQFALEVIEPQPALVPLRFDPAEWQSFNGLSGVSIEALIAQGRKKNKQQFLEDILITHKGLSGPGILQISSYWQAGQAIHLNLLPEFDLLDYLLNHKAGSKQKILTPLSQYLPKRLAQAFLAINKVDEELNWAEIPDKTLRQLAENIIAWTLYPVATVGYKKAEAMRGGISTKALNSKTMESKQQTGLYFIGEAVDMTGWLGGYNFQWAWASAVVCAQAL